MEEIDDIVDADADGDVDVEKPTQQLETTMEKIDDSVDTVASVDETGFINIFDKGYRVSLLAAKQGQTCLQPCFAKSDQQFKRDQLLHSACVAHVRSGNERAVKIAKTSKII